MTAAATVPIAPTHAALVLINGFLTKLTLTIRRAAERRRSERSERLDCVVSRLTFSHVDH